MSEHRRCEYDGEACAIRYCVKQGSCGYVELVQAAEMRNASAAWSGAVGRMLDRFNRRIKVRARLSRRA